ncbi:MAG TPA: hypothetical protein VIF15_03670, partial [Polyangiaceae bacterium]
VGLVTGALGMMVFSCTVTNATKDPYPDVSTFCGAVAKAECQDNALCAVDATQCQTYRTSVCTQDAAAAEASGRAYHSDKVQSCIDALNSAFGNSASSVKYAQLSGSGSFTDICEHVFVGTAGNGATCQTNYDCTDSSEICATVPGLGSSQCAKPTPKNVGDACADPGDQCSGDSYCASTAGGLPKCIAAATDGAACSASIPCIASDHCSSGICAVKGGPGSACSIDSDCGAQAPYCDHFAGSICAIGLTFATGAPDCKGYFLGSGISDGGTTEAGGGEAGTEGGTDGGGGDAATD